MNRFKSNLENPESEVNDIYKQLSYIANRNSNYLEGWFSDTVEELYEGKVVNNVCINGRWPNVYWNGSKLIFEWENQPKSGWFFIYKIL